MKMVKITLAAMFIGIFLATLWFTPSAPAGGSKSFAASTGVAIPEGYRNWQVISASHRTDKGEIRLILGNDVAMKAYRNKILPFPDGAILAKLAYKAEKHPTWESALIPGTPMRQEFMVKDSKKYGKTGGWGFGRFVDGKPVEEEGLYDKCFPCHRSLAPDQDFVFTSYAP